MIDHLYLFLDYILNKAHLVCVFIFLLISSFLNTYNKYLYYFYLINKNLKKRSIYFASTISFIAVFSSPSIVISTNAGIQTKFFPEGATKPRAMHTDLIA